VFGVYDGYLVVEDFGFVEVVCGVYDCCVMVWGCFVWVCSISVGMLTVCVMLGVRVLGCV